MILYFMTLLFVCILQYIVSLFWYSPLMFGKQWMKVMGVMHLSKEELSKMQKQMVPMYIIQFGLTLLTNIPLSLFFHLLRFSGALSLSLILWFCFIVPTQISSVIWGNTPKNRWILQISIMTSCQLVCFFIAAFIYSFQW